MIYATCLSEEAVLTEQELSSRMIDESVEMQFSIVKRYIDILSENTYECINESFADKAKSVITFIKKALTKVKDFFVKIVKLYSAVIGDLLGYIAPLYKNTFTVAPKMTRLKNENITKMLDKVPKTRMDKIRPYFYNKDSKDLEKILYDNNDAGGYNHAKQLSIDMINDIITPIGLKKITIEDDRLNTYDLVEKRQEDVIAVSAFMGVLKGRINKYKKILDDTNKKGDSLCKSYNADIAELDRMLNTEVPEGTSSERSRRDGLVLELVKSEYASLFYVASKIGKLQFDAVMLCLNDCKSTLEQFKTAIHQDQFKNRKAHEQYSKQKQKERFEREFGSYYKKGGN